MQLWVSQPDIARFTEQVRLRCSALRSCVAACWAKWAGCQFVWPPRGLRVEAVEPDALELGSCRRGRMSTEASEFVTEFAKATARFLGAPSHGTGLAVKVDWARVPHWVSTETRGGGGCAPRSHEVECDHHLTGVVQARHVMSGESS